MQNELSILVSTPLRRYTGTHGASVSVENQILLSKKTLRVKTIVITKVKINKLIKARFTKGNEEDGEANCKLPLSQHALTLSSFCVLEIKPPPFLFPA
jgi:hypothetical protein